MGCASVSRWWAINCASVVIHGFSFSPSVSLSSLFLTIFVVAVLYFTSFKLLNCPYLNQQVLHFFPDLSSPSHQGGEKWVSEWLCSALLPVGVKPQHPPKSPSLAFTGHTLSFTCLSSRQRSLVSQASLLPHQFDFQHFGITCSCALRGWCLNFDHTGRSQHLQNHFLKRPYKLLPWAAGSLVFPHWEFCWLFSSCH